MNYFVAILIGLFGLSSAGIVVADLFGLSNVVTILVWINLVMFFIGVIIITFWPSKGKRKE